MTGKLFQDDGLVGVIPGKNVDVGVSVCSMSGTGFGVWDGEAAGVCACGDTMCSIEIFAGGISVSVDGMGVKEWGVLCAAHDVKRTQNTTSKIRFIGLSIVTKN